MKRDYFAKSEQIYKGGRAMIIMDIKVDNIYAFKDFHISMHICCYILKAFFKIFLIFRPAIGKSFVILMKNCIIWIYFIPYA